MIDQLAIHIHRGRIPSVHVHGIDAAVIKEKVRTVAIRQALAVCLAPVYGEEQDCPVATLSDGRAWIQPTGKHFIAHFLPVRNQDGAKTAGILQVKLVDTEIQIIISDIEDAIRAYPAN